MPVRTAEWPRYGKRKENRLGRRPAGATSARGERWCGCRSNCLDDAAIASPTRPRIFAPPLSLSSGAVTGSGGRSSVACATSPASAREAEEDRASRGALAARPPVQRDGARIAKPRDSRHAPPATTTLAGPRGWESSAGSPPQARLEFISDSRRMGGRLASAWLRSLTNFLAGPKRKLRAGDHGKIGSPEEASVPSEPGWPLLKESGLALDRVLGQGGKGQL